MLAGKTPNFRNFRNGLVLTPSPTPHTLSPVYQKEAASGTPKPWFAYLSMISPHPPNWVPAGQWRHAYDGVQLPPLNYATGNIGELPYQTRMLLGLLGKEHDDPPAFPQGVPNMSYIDAPTGYGTTTISL